MKTFIVAIAILTASTAYAGQKYNPFSGRWETTPQDSEMRYNPHDNEWSYEKPDAKIEYNPYENTWDYNEKERDNDTYDTYR